MQSNFASIGFSTQNSGSTQNCTELPVAGSDRRCGNRNSSRSLQSHLSAMTTGSGTGLLAILLG
ncbi:MAG: hypothetical protein V7L19_30970 [Nostoc sp.]